MCVGGKGWGCAECQDCGLGLRLTVGQIGAKKLGTKFSDSGFKVLETGTARLKTSSLRDLV